MMVIEDLVEFVRGPGYVLNFSDRSFAEFFATELNIDINAPEYAANGVSKGKRLKCFLNKVDDALALKAIKALWEVREMLLLQRDIDDPITNAESRYLTLIDRLGGNPNHSSTPSDVPTPAFNTTKMEALNAELLQLSSLEPHKRGYAFESFLKSLFAAFDLSPRGAFRLKGEQIDGSFQLANETYLVEAKWESRLSSAADLHTFSGKLDQKAAWARGLFISYAGFSEDGLLAWGRGKRLICMDGLDLYEMLDRRIPLPHVLDRKIRRAAETGIAFTRLRDLFP
jgi:hypothetical protein